MKLLPFLSKKVRAQFNRKPRKKPQLVDYDLLEKLMREGYNPSVIPLPPQSIIKKKKGKKKDIWKPKKKHSTKNQIPKEERPSTVAGIIFSKPKEIVPTQFPLKPPEEE